MNWFQKRLGTDPNSYFTALDPIDFYEWKFSQRLPKGSVFSKGMPSSDTFTKGYVVVSTTIPAELLHKTGADIYELSAEIESDVHLRVGNVYSPSELIEKYQRMVKEFEGKKNHFSKHMIAQKYAVGRQRGLLSSSSFLYSFVPNGNRVQISVYDSLDNIRSHLEKTKQVMVSKSSHKQRRAYELEQLRRFETILTDIETDLSVDPAKVDYVFKLSGIQPVKTYTANWQDCFLNFSADAEQEHKRLQTIASMRWVKEALSILK